MMQIVNTEISSEEKALRARTCPFCKEGVETICYAGNKFTELIFRCGTTDHFSSKIPMQATTACNIIQDLRSQIASITKQKNCTACGGNGCENGWMDSPCPECCTH